MSPEIQYGLTAVQVFLVGYYIWLIASANKRYSRMALIAQFLQETDSWVLDSYKTLDIFSQDNITREEMILKSKLLIHEFWEIEKRYKNAQRSGRTAN